MTSNSSTRAPNAQQEGPTLCARGGWLSRLASIANPEHVKTIRLFATWRVLPALRNRAGRSNITPSVRRNAADQIKYATAFLIWLDKCDRTLASCRQSDIDAWYAENTQQTRAQVRIFLTWAMQSRQCSRSLSLPAGKISRQAPMTEENRLAALRRLLIDADVPPLLRVAGIIVLLYAQPLTRVVQLTVDDLLRDRETVFLRLGDPPSPVPEPVAALLLDYIAARDNMNTATNRDSRWLFPGRRAGQPGRPDHLSALLREIGIPAAAARGAAIRKQILEMPAPVVADALGYHDKTTARLLNEGGGTETRYAPGEHGRSPSSSTSPTTRDS